MWLVKVLIAVVTITHCCFLSPMPLTVLYLLADGQTRRAQLKNLTKFRRMIMGYKIAGAMGCGPSRTKKEDPTATVGEPILSPANGTSDSRESELYEKALRFLETMSAQPMILGDRTMLLVPTFKSYLKIDDEKLTVNTLEVLFKIYNQYWERQPNQKMTNNHQFRDLIPSIVEIAERSLLNADWNVLAWPCLTAICELPIKDIERYQKCLLELAHEGRQAADEKIQMASLWMLIKLYEIDCAQKAPDFNGADWQKKIPIYRQLVDDHLEEWQWRNRYIALAETCARKQEEEGLPKWEFLVDWATEERKKFVYVPLTVLLLIGQTPAIFHDGSTALQRAIGNLYEKLWKSKDDKRKELRKNAFVSFPPLLKTCKMDKLDNGIMSALIGCLVSLVQKGTANSEFAWTTLMLEHHRDVMRPHLPALHEIALARLKQGKKQGKNCSKEDMDRLKKDAKWLSDEIKYNVKYNIQAV